MHHDTHPPTLLRSLRLVKKVFQSVYQRSWASIVCAVSSASSSPNFSSRLRLGCYHGSMVTREYIAGIGGKGHDHTKRFRADSLNTLRNLNCASSLHPPHLSFGSTPCWCAAVAHSCCNVWESSWKRLKRDTSRSITATTTHRPSVCDLL